jgi:hypothetical protein
MTAIEQSSLQRAEQARDAEHLQSYQRMQRALLGYKEALQKFEEGLNELEDDIKIRQADLEE